MSDPVTVGPLRQRMTEGMTNRAEKLSLPLPTHYLLQPTDFVLLRTRVELRCGRETRKMRKHHTVSGYLFCYQFGKYGLFAQ